MTVGETSILIYLWSSDIRFRIIILLIKPHVGSWDRCLSYSISTGLLLTAFSNTERFLHRSLSRVRSLPFIVHYPFLDVKTDALRRAQLIDRIHTFHPRNHMVFIFRILDLRFSTSSSIAAHVGSLSHFPTLRCFCSTICIRWSQVCLVRCNVDIFFAGFDSSYPDVGGALERSHGA
jgi:hypothetical protein